MVKNASAIPALASGTMSKGSGSPAVSRLRSESSIGSDSVPKLLSRSASASALRSSWLRICTCATMPRRFRLIGPAASPDRIFSAPSKSPATASASALWYSPTASIPRIPATASKSFSASDILPSPKRAQASTSSSSTGPTLRPSAAAWISAGQSSAAASSASKAKAASWLSRA
jgi:hypothetical protein